MRWNKFIAGVAYVNMGMAVIKLCDFSDKGIENSKKIISVISALGNTYAIHGKIKQLRAIRSGLLSRKAIEAMGKFPNLIGAISGWLDAAIDIVDAGVNFSECDDDAAMALIASASCGILYGIGLPLKWPPAVLIALLVSGFGLGFLIAFLEDSPFERLVKNNPLRSFGKGQVPLNGDYLQVINYNLNNAKKLAKDNFSEWGDYVVLYESITDIMFGGRLTLESGEEDHELKTNVTISETTSTTKTCRVNILVSQPKEDISRIERYMYILPNGIYSPQTKKPIPPEKNSKGGYLKRKNTEDGKTIYMLDFKIPTEYQDAKYANAEMLFFYRIHLVDGFYKFPIEKKETARYMAIKVRIKNSLRAQSFVVINSFTISYNDKDINQFSYKKIFGDAIRTGTEAELLNYEKWK